MQKYIYLESALQEYKDFIFVYDTDLGVYIVSNNADVEKADTEEHCIFVNITDDNKKDSISDVLDYVDNFYSKTEEDIEDLEESLEEDTNIDGFGDVFLIKLIKINDNGEKYIEFDNIIKAQQYFDSLKINDNVMYTSAELYDENKELLDSWDFKVFEKISHSESSDIITEDSDIAKNTDYTDLFNSLLTSAYIFMNNCRMLHWYSTGIQFDTIHEIASTYYNKASEDFDLLAELSLEFEVPVNNPLLLDTTSSSIDLISIPESSGFVSEDFFLELDKTITNYIQCLQSILDVNEVNEDIKFEVTSLIRFWEKEKDYKNSRRLAN